MKLQRHFMGTSLCAAMLAGLLACGSAQANVKLPAIFGDHMVLQRGMGVPVWGWEDPGEQVTVTAGPAKVTAKAGPDGAWSVMLPTMNASAKPISVTIAGKNTIVIQDVLVGDVWVCSGQSNMEFGIKAFATQDELSKAGDPELRLFSIPKWVAPAPSKDIAPAPANSPFLGSWQVCTPEMLGKTGEWSGFSAVGYFFGHDIRDYTQQPVGMIESSWGGTRINAWMSLDTMQTIPAMAGFVKGAVDFRDNYQKIKDTFNNVTLPAWNATLAKWNADNKAALDAYAAGMNEWRKQADAAKAANQPAPPRPVAPKQPRPPRDMSIDPANSSALFNGMINPIIPYAIKGVIWYQGESNGDDPAFYKIALPALINDWRSHWKQGDFPFMIVQLPNFNVKVTKPDEFTWAGIREDEAQAQSLPNTGMAVTIDIGDPGVIHPSDKFDVGQRLALAAEHTAYGAKDIVWTGPTFKDFKAEGNKIRVSYDNTGSGLIIGTPPPHFYESNKKAVKADTSKLLGFEVAGADGKYAVADAVIDGNTVVVTSTEVPQPTLVRYAWANNPVCNLYNKEGLPAAPFRTDTTAFSK